MNVLIGLNTSPGGISTFTSSASYGSSSSTLTYSGGKSEAFYHAVSNFLVYSSATAVHVCIS